MATKLGSTPTAIAFLAMSVYMIQYLYRHHYAPGRYDTIQGWGQANWYYHRAWIQLHYLPATLALCLVPVQLWWRVRERYRRLHVWLGRFFFILVVVSMTGASYFAFVRPTPAAPTMTGTWWSTYAFQLVLVLSLLCGGLSWLRARQRRFRDHRRWVYRLISMIFGAGAQRAIYFAIFPDQWLSEYELYTLAVAWATGIPPLILVDWYLSSETAQKEPRGESTSDGGEPLLSTVSSDSSAVEPSSAWGGSITAASVAALATLACACVPAFWSGASPWLIAHGVLGLCAVLLLPLALIKPRSLAAPAAAVLGLATSLIAGWYSFVDPPQPPSSPLYFQLHTWTQRCFLAQGVQCWSLFGLMASTGVLVRFAQRHDRDLRRWLLRLSVILFAEAVRYACTNWFIPDSMWTATAYVAVTNSAWELPLLALEWCWLAQETATKELHKLHRRPATVTTSYGSV